MPLFNVTQCSVHFVILTTVTAYDKISKAKKILNIFTCPTSPYDW